jgi:hypothetical protein
MDGVPSASRVEAAGIGTTTVVTADVPWSQPGRIRRRHLDHSSHTLRTAGTWEVFFVATSCGPVDRS